MRSVPVSSVIEVVAIRRAGLRVADLYRPEDLSPHVDIAADVIYRLQWSRMIEVRQTAEFSRWLEILADPVGRAAVLTRVARLALGNAGDTRPVGDGV